jgi:hypothetical protein
MDLLSQIHYNKRKSNPTNHDEHILGTYNSLQDVPAFPPLGTSHSAPSASPA